MGKINWGALVAERNEWIAHNFPNPHIPNPGESVLGIIEEVGELAHAYLKSAQNIRGDREQHEKDGQDAIADISIYLLGVMNIGGLPPRLPFFKGTTSIREALMFLSLATGECALTYQEAEGHPSRPRGGDYQDVMDRIIWYCEEVCTHCGWDYEELVIQTWLKVKQRDWAAYPETGLRPAEEKIPTEPATRKEEEAWAADHPNAIPGIRGDDV